MISHNKESKDVSVIRKGDPGEKPARQDPNDLAVDKLENQDTQEFLLNDNTDILDQQQDPVAFNPTALLAWCKNQISSQE